MVDVMALLNRTATSGPTRLTASPPSDFHQQTELRAWASRSFELMACLRWASRDLAVALTLLNRNANLLTEVELSRRYSMTTNSKVVLTVLSSAVTPAFTHTSSIPRSRSRLPGATNHWSRTACGSPSPSAAAAELRPRKTGRVPPSTR